MGIEDGSTSFPQTVLSFEGSPLPPPSYEDVMLSINANQNALTFHDTDSPSACAEMLCSCSTYLRLLTMTAILTSIVMMVVGPMTPFDWPYIVGACLFCVGYTVYMVGVFKYGSDYKFLRKPSKATDDIYRHVDAVRAAPPVIVWMMNCYHYETRAREVERGTGLDRRTETETYKEKVSRWSGHQEFVYSHWADVSGPDQLQRLPLSNNTRVRFIKRCELNGQETEAAFKLQKERFLEANRNRDEHYDLAEEFLVKGFVPAMLAGNSDPEKRPFFLCLHWYVLAVVFLLELPFSFMIKREAELVEYVYVKRLSSAPPLPYPPVSGR